MTQADHSRVRRKIRDLCAVRGWHADTNGPAQTAGRHDMTLCVGGRFVSVEIKTGRGEQTPAQRHYAEQIRRAGGLVIEARSLPQFLEDMENTMPSLDQWFALGRDAVQAIDNLARALRDLPAAGAQSGGLPSSLDTLKETGSFPENNGGPVDFPYIPNLQPQTADLEDDPQIEEEKPKRRGRPAGSKNKKQAESGVPESMDETIETAVGAAPETGMDAELDEFLAGLTIE